MSAPLPPVPDRRPPPTRGFGEARWHYRRSLASRVTLLTTIAVGVTVALLSLSVYLVVRVQMQQTMDEQLVERARAASQAADEPYENGVLVIQGYLVAASDTRVAFLSSDGSMATSEGQPGIPYGDDELDVARGSSQGVLRTVAIEGETYRVATVPVRSGLALMVAQETASQQSFLGKLGLVMLLFGGTGVALAGVAGTVVARNGLRPVRRLTDAVEEIARTEDLTPLRIEGDDEIARLASAFNQMLTAIGASRDRQRQLVADASHELKTPLTSLRTNLDLLAQVEDADADRLPPEMRRELIDDVRAQIVELSTLVGDLVELARDEPLRHVVEPVSLVEVLDRSVARVRLRAPSVAFEVRAAPWWLTGEAHSLERAITNLLDNAAKWSPPEGRVVATLANGILTVDDEGPGIAEADLPLVFDRFFRSTESRAMSGSGLGLSIVRQIAERHAGQVTAGRSPAGGARLTLSLPGSPLHPDAVPAPEPEPAPRGRRNSSSQTGAERPPAG